MPRVLVTGAAGQLGSEVGRALLRAGFELTSLGRGQLDVTDGAACSRALDEAAPVVVIDCADPGGDRRAEGAGVLAAAARAAGRHTVFFSCADVFDGAAAGPYVESDPTSPRDANGSQKLEAERAVARANPQHTIVRTSWLYAVGHANLVEDLLTAAADVERLELDVTTHSSPTYVPHLATAVVALARHPIHGIVHLAAGGSTTRLALARALFRQVGVPCRPVARPPGEGEEPGEVHLVLGTRRPDAPTLPDWRLGLREYAEARRRAVPGTRPRGQHL